MLITMELATYLDRAVKAIEAGRSEIPLTNTCPECGEKVDTYLDAVDQANPHMVMQVTSDNFAILVGCEGYWMVNPATLGLDGRGWSDWTENALGDEMR